MGHTYITYYYNSIVIMHKGKLGNYYDQFHLKSNFEQFVRMRVLSHFAKLSVQ